MTTLQVAFDRIPLLDAVSLTRIIAPLADWIEVGTSLIKAHGMAAVSQIVAAAGSTPVIADTKTADDAATEVEMCAAAGARAVTVLAVAPDSVIAAAVARTGELGMELLVDLLAAPSGRRQDLLSRHGAQSHLIWGAHVGKDDQAAGRRPTSGDDTAGFIAAHRSAVAGGLTVDAVPALVAADPDLRLIVGSAITKADDPGLATALFRSACRVDLGTTAVKRDGRSMNSELAADEVDIILGEITAAVGVLDRAGIGALADEVMKAPRVFVTGEGRSGYLARTFAMRLMHLGIDVHYIGDTCTPSVSAGDLLIALSGSGTTAGTLRVTEAARNQGCRTLAVTSDRGSALATDADVLIQVPGATKHRRSGELTTVQPLSSLFDQCLHLALDAAALRIARRRDIDNQAASRAHANTE